MNNSLPKCGMYLFINTFNNGRLNFKASVMYTHFDDLQRLNISHI